MKTKSSVLGLLFLVLASSAHAECVVRLSRTKYYSGSSGAAAIDACVADRNDMYTCRDSLSADGRGGWVTQVTQTKYYSGASGAAAIDACVADRNDMYTCRDSLTCN